MKKLVIVITDSEGATHETETNLPDSVTNQSLSLAGTVLTLTDSEGHEVTVDLASAIPTDTDTTNASLALDGYTLTLTDSAGSVVTADLTDLAGGGTDNLVVGTDYTTAPTASGNGIAAGDGAKASATAGIALGANADSSAGQDAIAIGSGSKATHANSVAIGVNSESSGENEFSVGKPTARRKVTNVADGVSATDAATVGQLNTVASSASSKLVVQQAYATAPIATGVNSMAAGTASEASGYDSVALGVSATASGPESIAIGAFATASDGDSIAIGNGALASKYNAVAIGSGSIASSADTVSFGTDTVQRRLVNVGSPSEPNDAVNLISSFMPLTVHTVTETPTPSSGNPYEPVFNVINVAEGNFSLTGHETFSAGIPTHVFLSDSENNMIQMTPVTKFTGASGEYILKVKADFTSPPEVSIAVSTGITSIVVLWHPALLYPVNL